MNDKIESRLQDALDAACLINRWASTDSIENITEDLKLESAYMHQFTRIGEALRIVRDFDPVFAETIPEVHQWIGLRHRIVHDYREIDLDLLWTAARHEIPSLVTSLENALSR